MFAQPVQAQNSTCQKLLQREFTLDDLKQNFDSISEDINGLLGCGLDTFELKSGILEQAFTSVITSDINNLGKKHTLREVMNMLKIARKQEGYNDIKIAFEAYMKVNRRIISRNSWDGIKKELLEAQKIDEDEPQVILFEKYILEQFEKKGNYLHLSLEEVSQNFQDYMTDHYNSTSLITPGFDNFDKNLPSMQFDKAFEAITDTTKPVLVFFNGHGCISCKQFENQVMNDPFVVLLLSEHFHVINLHLDSRKKLTEEEEVFYKKKYEIEFKRSGRRLNNLGALNQLIQLKLKEDKYRADILIIDYQQNVISDELDYRSKSDNALRILNEVLVKMKDGNK